MARGGKVFFLFKEALINLREACIFKGGINSNEALIPRLKGGPIQGYLLKTKKTKNGDYKLTQNCGKGSPILYPQEKIETMF